MARRLGAPKASVMTAVFAHWEEIVGPSVGAHVRPLSLRGRVLVVATDQPAWASQLRFLVPDLLRRLAAITGDEAIEQVDISGGPGRIPVTGSRSDLETTPIVFRVIDQPFRHPKRPENHCLRGRAYGDTTAA